MEKENKNLYLKNLTDRIVDFPGADPEMEWFFLVLSNRPSYLWEQQIEILISAFCGDKISLKNFVRGGFIEGKSLNQFRELIQKIETNYPDFKTYPDTSKSLDNLAILMPQLLDYKRRLCRAIYFNPNPIMPNSNPYSDYMNLIIKSHKHCFEEVLIEIDTMIEELVQPQKSVFTKQELVENYKLSERILRWYY